MNVPILTSVIEAVDVGLFLLDRHGGVVLANAAARPVLGALGSGRRNLAEQRCPENRHRAPASCLTCLAEAPEPRLCLVSVAGGVYELQVTPLHSSPGEEATRVCVLRDITEDRRAAIWQGHEERLAVVGEIAAVIAHELNNPLTAILMFSQLLLDQLDADSPAYNCARVIHRNTLACRHTMLTLLEMARSAPTKRGELELQGVVDDVIELLRPLAARAHVELHTVGERGDASIHADEHQIRQALTNVVINAIHAAGETGRGDVRIGIEVRAQDVVIRVEDNGAGVPAALAERIFEPFFTTKAAGEGTGLGLPTSRRIVEAHGGRLVLCPGRGRGAVFEIRLPRSEKRSTGAAPRGTPAEPIS